jgi:hypothetical protein
MASSGPGGVENRREKRLNVAVPVKVFLDPQSPESEACCTFEISMVGARLMRFRGVEKVGQTVWLQRHNKRAPYKVIWIGESGTNQEGQVGVEVLEPSNIIWENELRLRIMQG